MQKQRQIYADRVVARVQNTLSAILLFVQILWIAGFFLVVSEPYENQFGQKVMNWIYSGADQLSGGQLLSILFAPFITPIIINIALWILKRIRRLAFFRGKFHERVDSQIAEKKVVHRGSSESDWEEYYFTVPHPYSDRPFTFYVDEYTFRKYEKGDRIRVAFNQKFQSILILEPEQTV